MSYLIVLFDRFAELVHAVLHLDGEEPLVRIQHDIRKNADDDDGHEADGGNEFIANFHAHAT